LMRLFTLRFVVVVVVVARMIVVASLELEENISFRSLNDKTRC
jgi:hypothetical protein